MLARIRKSMEEKDQGFTLIELLVVMIIIGILAAIAIPVFLNQKKKAKETAAKSDATNISKEVAAFQVDGDITGLAIAQTAAQATAGNTEWTLTANYSATVSDTAVVKVSGDNKPAVALTGQDYCVTVSPATAGAFSAWSAGNNGLKKGATC